MGAVGEVQQQERGVARILNRCTVRTITVDEGLHASGDPDHVTEEPAGDVNHVRTQFVDHPL